jgi:hypothetical protein
MVCSKVYDIGCQEGFPAPCGYQCCNPIGSVKGTHSFQTPQAFAVVL